MENMWCVSIFFNNPPVLLCSLKHMNLFGFVCRKMLNEWELSLLPSFFCFSPIITLENTCRKMQEVIDEDDEVLNELRSTWGEAVFDAVANALLELNEYNPSGRYVVSELWNFREGRKASLKEATQCLIQQLKALSSSKRKRR